MARYTRCNPFGSEEVRFGAPCRPRPFIPVIEARIPIESRARKEIALDELRKMHPIKLPPRTIPVIGLRAFSDGFSEGFS